MTAQKGQRHGVAAVIHPAREFFSFEEGDVVRVRHDQFTVLAASRHDELAQHGLGLLRCGDADGTFPHDARRQSRRALHRAAHAVRADGGHHADRHVGERFGQTGIRQLHHSQPAARSPKAGGGCGQLRRRAGQRLCAAQRFRCGAEQGVRHRLAVDADPLFQRLTACTVQTGDETGSLKHRCRQGGGSGLARRAGHAHIGHLLRRCGQRRAQFFRRGEPLRQSSKILICLFDGHCVNPRFDVYRAGCTSG